jgi:hypothetical protein
MALRHINVPVLLRIGMLALEVRSDASARINTAAPEWREILADKSGLETIASAALQFAVDRTI